MCNRANSANSANTDTISTKKFCISVQVKDMCKNMTISTTIKTTS